MPAAEAGDGVGRLGRTFACALCQREVVLCSGCDRGQRYCGVACREQARRHSLRAARRRYQDSRAGRFAHARRARRYRQRLRAPTRPTSPPWRLPAQRRATARKVSTDPSTSQSASTRRHDPRTLARREPARSRQRAAQTARREAARRPGRQPSVEAASRLPVVSPTAPQSTPPRSAGGAAPLADRPKHAERTRPGMRPRESPRAGIRRHTAAWRGARHHPLRITTSFDNPNRLTEDCETTVQSWDSTC